MELYPIQWENHSVSVVGRPRIQDTLCIDGLSGQPKFLVGTPRAVSNYKDTIFIGLFRLESVLCSSAIMDELFYQLNCNVSKKNRPKGGREQVVVSSKMFHKFGVWDFTGACSDTSGEYYG